MSYSFITLNEKEKKTLKATSRAASKNQVQFKQYKSCSQMERLSRQIRKEFVLSNNEIYTIEINLSLHPFNDKIFLLNDEIKSLGYGHYKIAEIQNKEEEMRKLQKDESRKTQPFHHSVRSSNYKENTSNITFKENTSSEMKFHRYYLN